MQTIPMIKLVDKDPTNQNTAKRLLESGQPLTVEQIFAIQNAIDIAQKNLSILQEQVDMHKSKINAHILASIDPVLVFENATKRYTYALSTKTTTKYTVDDQMLFNDAQLFGLAHNNGFIIQALDTKAIIKAAKEGILTDALKSAVSMTTASSLRVIKREEDLVTPNANL